jgi:GDP-L-fucose synthase
MNKTILVTGGSGLVGRHLKKILPEAIYISSKDFDLTNEQDVISMFELYKPTSVIHLAAMVGGILDNMNKQAEYFTKNTLMNTLMVHYSYKYGVKQFVGMLSTCIYPDTLEKYPMDESVLHLGPPAETNFSYGYSKRCLSVQIDSYNKQYGTKYNYLIPCNLYGENDKDDENKSHFVTALIKKIQDANKNNQNEITLFGDGTPMRQFMLVDDLVEVIKYVIENDITESFNVATIENYTIKQIAEISLKASNSENIKLKFDTTKPNGQYRKDVSIEKLKSIIPNYNPTTLYDGIKKLYEKL